MVVTVGKVFCEDGTEMTRVENGDRSISVEDTKK
jgi:hypothetical protein